MINELGDSLKDLVSRKEDFTSGIEDILTEVTGTKGFNQARKDITKYTKLVSSAEGEANIDAMEKLKEAYEALWKVGKGEYEEGTEAYVRLQEEVATGLEDLLEQGKDEFDSQIDVLKEQLGILDSTLTVEKAIEQKIKDAKDLLDADLEAIRLQEAAQHAVILGKYADIILAIQGEVGEEITTITAEVRAAFIDEITAALTIQGAQYTIQKDMKDWLEKIYIQLGGKDISTEPGVFLGSMATGTNYVPETGPYLLHQGEAVIPAGQNNAQTFVFVPYGASEAEQDRIFNEEVKPRLLATSENEQFIYDNAIIQTNKGI